MMQKKYYIVGVLLFFIAFIGKFLSSQNPINAQEVAAWKTKAEQFAKQLKNDSAVYYYQKAIKYHKEHNQIHYAVELYYPTFLSIALGVEHNDIELSEFEHYLANIEQDVYAANNPKWLVEFYIAKMDFFFKARAPIDSTMRYMKALEQTHCEEQNLYLFAGYIMTSQRYYILNNLKNSRIYINKASEIINSNPELNNSRYTNVYFSTRGAISYTFADLEDALECTLKCLALTEKEEVIDVSSLIADYTNLATLYGALGDIEKEIIYNNKSIGLIEKAQLKPMNAIVNYQNLSLCAQFQKKYNEAITYAKQGIKLAHDFNDYNAVASGFTDIAETFYYAQQIDSAKYYCDLYLQYQKRHKLNSGKTVCYIILSDIAIDEQRYNDALNYLDKGVYTWLDLYGNKGMELSKLYRYRGASLFKLNRYQDALNALNDALHASTINFESKSYTDLPPIESVINKMDLLAVIRNRVPILEEFAALYPDSLTLEDVYEQAKIGVKVLEEYQRNLSVVSKESAMGIESARTYSQAMDLAIKLYKRSGNKKYLDEAFLLSEKSKSSLLLEALHANDMYKGIPDSLLQREKRLTNLITQIEKSRFDATLRQDSLEISSHNSLLFKYRRELDSLKNKLRTEYAQYYNHGTDIKLATLSDIQQQLDNESTLIEFFESKKNYYVFVIDKQHTQLHTIPLSDSLRMRMQAYQADLSNAKKVVEDPLLSYNTLIKESYELYRRLIQPILKDIKTKRLIIIPDGFLGYIPFEAFITQPYQPAQTVMEAKFDQLKYLLFDYTMSYNYSATLWWEQLGQANKPVSMSCLGMASTYQNRTIPASRSPREQILRKEMAELQGVAREVEYLERDWSGDYFVGMASTERAFKQYAPQHGILHLAMHGIVDKTYPEYSSLAFSEDNDTLEDNFLYAYEVKQLNLNAALVVLSACETGAGKYLHGEGVLSLGRGFMHAGVASILMTLWQLNDQTGSLLMPDFYENLRAKMFKDEAIRQAKIKYLNNMKGSAAHPALWACFIQVGDYRPVEERTNIYKWLAIACGGATCIGLAVWWRQRRNRLKIS